jgi:hypothetical protein
LRSSFAAPTVVWRAVALVYATLIGASVFVATARADAPALAVTLAAAELLAEPAAGSAVLAEIPADTQVELTGAAVPGHVEVLFQQQRGWVAAALLDAGSGPGVPLATATRELPIRDAPLPEGNVVGRVPRGGTVILTGAEIDGYLAAAYRGTGGWVLAAGLRREDSAALTATRCDARPSSPGRQFAQPSEYKRDRATGAAHSSSVSPRRSAA